MPEIAFRNMKRVCLILCSAMIYHTAVQKLRQVWQFARFGVLTAVVPKIRGQILLRLFCSTANGLSYLGKSTRGVAGSLAM